MTGCYSPYADESLVIRPTGEDVIGNYEFDFQTVDCSLDKKNFEKVNY
jgi:hypothetical protein